MEGERRKSKNCLDGFRLELGFSREGRFQVPRILGLSSSSYLLYFNHFGSIWVLLCCHS